MSNNSHIYELDLSWEQDRIGNISSAQLEDTLTVATPPPFPGGIEGIWSPEHLFIASLSSCFMTTFLAIAEISKLEFESLNVHAAGTVGKSDGKLSVNRVVLKAELIIADSKHAEKAKRILEKAEVSCLISRSVKTEVILEPKVTIGALS